MKSLTLRFGYIPIYGSIKPFATQPIDFFGISEVANPAAAHSDYDHDERVIEITAHGVGQVGVSPLLEESCSWIKTIEND